MLGLSGCGESNTYVAPPPPKVTVAKPVEKPYTRYLTATGNAAAINTANLVARVAGFLQSVNYTDGTFVKKGTLLFVIEPEPYKLQVEQSKAAEEGAQASYKQQAAELTRQQDLAAKDISSKALLDKQIAATDNAKATLQSSTANVSIAEINYGYTHVRAPFDGIVTARQVSVGDYVGGGGQATPSGAIAITVTEKGFEPAEVRVTAGQPVKLVVTRKTERKRSGCSLVLHHSERLRASRLCTSVIGSAE